MACELLIFHPQISIYTDALQGVVKSDNLYPYISILTLTLRYLLGTFDTQHI
jgi:hypothetical protein